MTYDDFISQYGLSLNEQQAAAVQSVEGHILLLAVPGSGKTTTLVSRLGYMILACDIPPNKILTMTYTVAATQDMRNRFATMFGEELAQRLEFRTINGVSARIIYRYERMTGRKAFTLLSDERQLNTLITEMMTAVSEGYPTASDVKAVRTAITYVKNQMLSEEDIRAMEEDIEHFSTIYQTYQRTLRERGWMDFDDQMVYARAILRKYPALRRAFQTQYRYLCVDEAQDTSRIQHEIITLLSGGNLFMVGDEDQSIYGFRAAYPQALLSFDTQYPDARILFMERNYRSTASIVKTANQFIAQNVNRRPKTMYSVRGEGLSPRDIVLEERKNQYAYLLKLARHCSQETAVLYRDNDCALPLIDLLERAQIPYRMSSVDSGFFTHRVVQDITDIIRLSLHPADEERFLRIYYKFSAGISRKAAQNAIVACTKQGFFEQLSQNELLNEWTRRRCRELQTHLERLPHDNGARAVRRIVYRMGYGDYLREHKISLQRPYLLEILGKQESSAERLLCRLEELRAIMADPAPAPEATFILSTIHSSKGLEYDRVVLMDVIDGILPKQGENVDLEEERRLFYVAMTRARNELSLFTFRNAEEHSSFSEQIFPKQKTKQTSKQNGEKHHSFFPVRKTIDRGETRQSVPEKEMLAAFSVGTPVWHQTFGRGNLMARKGDIVTIEFATGEKRLCLSVALKSRVLRPVSK